MVTGLLVLHYADEGEVRQIARFIKKLNQPSINTVFSSFIQKLFCDVILCQIYEGTSQIQRLLDNIPLSIQRIPINNEAILK